MEIYHGSGMIVEFPEIKKTKYTKDFSWGFYCTKNYEQAYRWAERRHEDSVVNIYSYAENSELNILRFEKMTDEWLDFIAECRSGKSGNISREVFWEYAKFKHPTHQISFHTLKALDCLKFERGELIHE